MSTVGFWVFQKIFLENRLKRKGGGVYLSTVQNRDPRFFIFFKIPKRDFSKKNKKHTYKTPFFSARAFGARHFFHFPFIFSGARNFPPFSPFFLWGAPAARPFPLIFFRLPWGAPAARQTTPIFFPRRPENGLNGRGGGN